MNTAKKLYLADISRYGGACSGEMKRFHYYFRKAQNATNPLLKLYYRWMFSRCKQKNHIELYAGTKVGGGLYLGHPYCITVNPAAQLGSNVNLHKGVTIGQENRGPRKGVPVIGDCVWIGVNATVVGNVQIGSDVLIAPNSYVNCDVPDHSLVFGNPCVVKPRECATQGYINRIVAED